MNPLALALLLASPLPAIAQSPAANCGIQPYRGATTPEGALVIVTMVNRGQACRLPVFAHPSERAGPASSGRILVAPKTGAAAFDPPSASDNNGR